MESNITSMPTQKENVDTHSDVSGMSSQSINKQTTYNPMPYSTQLAFALLYSCTFLYNSQLGKIYHFG